MLDADHNKILRGSIMQVIFDTETTGRKMNHDRVVEIGAVKIMNRRIVEGAVFQTYLNPAPITVHPEALKIHGLSDAFLDGQPSFSAIAPAFLEFISGAELLAHNLEFDLGMINHELRLLLARGHDFKLLHELCTTVDTLMIARRLHPGRPNDLNSLCQRYCVDKQQRQWHGALLDAQLLAQVYLAMTDAQQRDLWMETTTDPFLHSINRNLDDPSIEPMMIADLPVIEPSAEEYNAHQAFMDFLAKKAAIPSEK